MTERGLELAGGSAAAADKVRAVLLPFFAGWADTPPGRALLGEAETRRLTALVDRLDREAAEAEQHAAALRDQHAAALAELAHHRGLVSPADPTPASGETTATAPRP